MSKKSFYLLAFIMFLSMTGYGIVLPVLPFLADNLGLSSVQMSSLITAWALTQFIVLPFWGRMIDRLGRKPVLIVGLIGFGIAFLLMVFAESYMHLLVIRIIGAILSSGTQPAVLALVADWSDKENRANALAKIVAANGLGFLLGPIVGGIFSPFGIEVPFIVAGMLSLIAVPFAVFYVKESAAKQRREKAESFKESIIIATKPDNLRLFLIVFGSAVSVSSLFGILGYFMIEKFASSASQTGWAFTIQALAAVLFQLFIMAKLYQRFSEESIAKYGVLIEAFGFAFIMLSMNSSFVYIGCFLIGTGQALMKPTVLALLSKKSELGQGSIMSFHGAIDSLGRSVGPLLAGLFFTVHSAAPFLFACCICIMLFFLLFFEQSKYIRYGEYLNEEKGMGK